MKARLYLFYAIILLVFNACESRRCESVDNRGDHLIKNPMGWVTWEINEPANSIIYTTTRYLSAGQAEFILNSLSIDTKKEVLLAKSPNHIDKVWLDKTNQVVFFVGISDRNRGNYSINQVRLKIGGGAETIVDNVDPGSVVFSGHLMAYKKMPNFKDIYVYNASQKEEKLIGEGEPRAISAASGELVYETPTSTGPPVGIVTEVASGASWLIDRQYSQYQNKQYFWKNNQLHVLVILHNAGAPEQTVRVFNVRQNSLEFSKAEAMKWMSAQYFISPDGTQLAHVEPYQQDGPCPDMAFIVRTTDIAAKSVRDVAYGYSSNNFQPLQVKFSADNRALYYIGYEDVYRVQVPQ